MSTSEEEVYDPTSEDLSDDNENLEGEGEVETQEEDSSESSE